MWAYQALYFTPTCKKVEKENKELERKQNERKTHGEKESKTEDKQMR